MGRSRSGAEHSSGRSPTGNLPDLACLLPTARKVCSYAWASACGISNREDPGKVSFPGKVLPQRAGGLCCLARGVGCSGISLEP